MTWVKLTDTFPEDPKVEQLSNRAFRLHVTALCHCARNLTDGKVTSKALKVIAASAGVPKTVANELENASLWVRNGDGFVIENYLNYNPSSEQIREERSKARSRMRAIRSAEQKANVRENFGGSSGVRSGTPTRPDPTRTTTPTHPPPSTEDPDPKGKGGREEPEEEEILPGDVFQEIPW